MQLLEPYCLPLDTVNTSAPVGVEFPVGSLANIWKSGKAALCLSFLPGKELPVSQMNSRQQASCLTTE